MPMLVQNLLRLAVAILSLLVFLVGFVAWRRRPTTRMFIVLALFLVFLLQGALLVVEVFLVDTQLTESAYYGFQLVEIALVSLVILKR